VVVVVEGMPHEGALEAAREQVPAAWRLAIARPAPSPPPGPELDVASLAEAYRDADFLRCLSDLQRVALDPDRLLQTGRRQEAAEVTVLAGACALGAGEEQQARDTIRRLFVRELDAPHVFVGTTPSFQQLADEERQRVRRLARISVEIVTEPPGGEVDVDGRMICPSAPCRAHLLPGEHLVRAQALAHRAWFATALLERDQELTVAFGPASADEAARQLGVLLASDSDPSGVQVLLTAATAFGANLLVLVWRHGSETHAIAYQRQLARPIHVVMDLPDRGAAATIVRAALREWRNDTPCWDASLYGGARLAARLEVAESVRPPRWRRVAWGMAVGAVLAGAVAVFLLSRNTQPGVGLGFR